MTKKNIYIFTLLLLLTAITTLTFEYEKRPSMAGCYEIAELESQPESQTSFFISNDALPAAVVQYHSSSLGISYGTQRHTSRLLSVIEQLRNFHFKLHIKQLHIASLYCSALRARSGYYTYRQGKLLI